MPDEINALWFPSPHYFPNRFGHIPSYIILHGTASPGAFYAQDIARYFQREDVEVSTHYIVGRDGIVCQCVGEHDGAFGNGVIEDGPNRKADFWWGPLNPNLITISIEHVMPDPNNATGLTDLQKQASFPLVRDICVRWNIPMRQAGVTGGITGHFSIDPLNRAHCPGNYPWNELWAFLKEQGMADLSNPILAQYFALYGDAWRCKQKTSNGLNQPDFYGIRGAILEYYRSFSSSPQGGLTLLGLPLENEHPFLDAKGNALPQIAEQQFERGVIRYDPAHITDRPPGSGDCFLAHIDALYSLPVRTSQAMAELAQTSSALQQYTKENADLKAQLDGAIAHANELLAQLTLCQEKQPAGTPLTQEAVTAALADMAETFTVDLRKKLGLS